MLPDWFIIECAWFCTCNLTHCAPGSANDVQAMNIATASGIIFG